MKGINDILQEMVKVVLSEEAEPARRRWNTRYQFLVSIERYDLFRMWLRDKDIPPSDALYIPMDKRVRWRKIEGIAGYHREQLIGAFSSQEIERLTRGAK